MPEETAKNSNTLREWLPGEYWGEYAGTKEYKRVDSFLDEKVLFAYNNMTCETVEGVMYANRTPFKHKNIYSFAVLENGYAVGWNENPSKGWSFPIIKVRPYDRNAKLLNPNTIWENDLDDKIDNRIIAYQEKHFRNVSGFQILSALSHRDPVEIIRSIGRGVGRVIAISNLADMGQISKLVALLGKGIFGYVHGPDLEEMIFLCADPHELANKFIEACDGAGYPLDDVKNPRNALLALLKRIRIKFVRDVDSYTTQILESDWETGKFRVVPGEWMQGSERPILRKGIEPLFIGKLDDLKYKLYKDQFHDYETTIDATEVLDALQDLKSNPVLLDYVLKCLAKADIATTPDKFYCVVVNAEKRMPYNVKIHKTMELYKKHCIDGDFRLKKADHLLGRVHTSFADIESEMMESEGENILGFGNTKGEKYTIHEIGQTEPRIGDYDKDLKEWKNSFTCGECGEDKKECFAHQRTVANGDVWECEHCKTETLVENEPNEGDY